ncbi:cyclic GMP-AMP synthase-like receptor isoform X10 [Mytilus galloprovincialis]|uniref:cyclic GMP-AMP synthase-like receptor isoform X10 n=1 Tax=Mytilus galloprovincialis TaxID=29158 RepID=UPI003F7BF7CE
MKRSEERRYNNYDYPRCEGFKSPITIRDDQENKGKLASATSNQATTETHDPITSNNNEQRQPFAPRHKVNTEIQFENHEDGQESHIRVHTPRRNKHEQYGHRRSYTPRDYADSEPNRFYNENGNLYHRRIHKHRPNKHEQHGQGRFYTPRDNDTEHPMSNLEDGYHGTPRPNKHDQYRHRRSYTSKDDVERECSSSEGNHHDYRRARYKDQYGYRQCYVQRDAESEEQATKHCPRTTDLHECYNEKRTDKCGKEKSPSTPLEKVKAQDQAPVSPISKERLIDHQGKCKLAMEEVSPAAKAINSFTNEFIKKLKEISTLNWSSFNIGSYYDKTKNCHPDEFDIMIYPNLSVEVNFDVIKIPGFYKVKLVSPRVQELEHVLDNDRYIIPGKFKNYAFEMFDRVLGTDGIRQGRRTKKMPKPGGCSPAYTVFYDAFPGKKSIDIDLVPCFNIDGWPPDKIARKINPSWIAIDDVVNRAMKYYDVVCKTCPEDATDKNLLFRLSFSRTEKMLIKHANSADKLNLKKNAFRFIKLCIQDLKDKHPGEIKKFCSYHIKQFMLTQYDTWPTREREGVRIQRYLIGELIKTLSLANPTIANYFITNDNVIRYVPSEEIAVIVKGLQEKDKLLH